MELTTEGIALIQQFESCVLSAYQDQGGIWTIGWGHTANVKEGDTCSQAQADAWFFEDLTFFKMAVLNCVGKATVLNPNQLSALTSFCFNVGLGYAGKKDGFLVLRGGAPSTMLKRLRDGNYAGAAHEFPKWDKVNGEPCAGILKRRLAEQSLFLKTWEE